MSEDTRAYYARRAEAERASAEKSTDPAAARIHREMATHYEAIVTGTEEPKLRIAR